MADGAYGEFADAAEQPGAVILARHGEPALSRKRMLSADEYREWWADYEIGGLAEGQTPPELLQRAADRAGFIIASTRLRSVETARAVAGSRAFAEDALFIEAPLPPPHWPGWLKLSPRVWGFVSRFWWWWFNHHDQQETRAQAQVRADEAARQLIELAAGGQDVLVVAHGFFNTMVGLSLRRQGWRCVEDGGFRYWSARRFEMSRSTNP
jgi:broad specificity phosphatase PhoE